MNKELLQKDKEEKAIKFYKNYIENQEKELDWMYKQDEEYYRDEIEQKELLIKGFRTILNLIQKQEKIIDKATEILQEAKLAYFTKEDGGELIGQYRCFNKDDWKKYLKKEVEKENEQKNIK